MPKKEEAWYSCTDQIIFESTVYLHFFRVSSQCLHVLTQLCEEDQIKVKFYPTLVITSSPRSEWQFLPTQSEAPT